MFTLLVKYHIWDGSTSKIWVEITEEQEFLTYILKVLKQIKDTILLYGVRLEIDGG